MCVGEAEQLGRGQARGRRATQRTTASIPRMQSHLRAPREGTQQLWRAGGSGEGAFKVQMLSRVLQGACAGAEALGRGKLRWEQQQKRALQGGLNLTRESGVCGRARQRRRGSQSGNRLVALWFHSPSRRSIAVSPEQKSKLGNPRIELDHADLLCDLRQRSSLP